MIAEALNYCTCNGQMVIKGYLVTCKRVCLVLETEKEKIKDMLAVFYSALQKEIQQYTKRMGKVPVTTGDNEDAAEEEGAFTQLYRECPFVNQALVKLITGGMLYSSYHDPCVEKLKNMVRNNNYCSAIEYAGGKGMVIRGGCHNASE
jgi:hypothetical protein